MSSPEASSNSPVEEAGLQTKAAAVPGLGVAPSCSRTPTKGEMSESVEAGLLLRLEEGLKLVVAVAVVQEGVSLEDSVNRVGTGDVQSQTYGSFVAKDPGVDTSYSEACTAKAAIRMLLALLWQARAWVSRTSLIRYADEQQQRDSATL